jgi:hypothetical protein
MVEKAERLKGGRAERLIGERDKRGWGRAPVL